MRVLFPIAALTSLLLAACSSAPGSSAVASSQASPASPPQFSMGETPMPPARPVTVEEPAKPPAAVAEVPRKIITDDLLVEGPANRDPFRAFSDAPPPPPQDTRPRKARRVSIDQLKLVALVTNTATPRAMLVDPAGKGYIVTQGELVGRPEPQGDRFASFRVDRIRESDVVLVREDPMSPGAPGPTRVLALPRTPLLQADD